MGRLLGRLLYRLVKRRRHIAEVNIARCFPELTGQERQALVKEHFATNGMALMEVGMVWFMPAWRLRKRFVIKGREHWAPFRQQARGALVIGLHFNTLEIANVAMNRLFSLSFSYRSRKNPVYNYLQYTGRKRRNKQAHGVDRHDIRGMVNTMKAGGLLWYAPDQDYGRGVSEFIPWFGVAAATLAATPRLLRMAKVPALGVIYRRLPDYSGYQVEFRPVLEGLPSGDDRADLLALNQYIEARIRENPAEYLWVHRRFKTRPQGEAGFY